MESFHKIPKLEVGGGGKKKLGVFKKKKRGKGKKIL